MSRQGREEAKEKATSRETIVEVRGGTALGKTEVSAPWVQKEIGNLSKLMKNFLENVHADIQEYKFNVESAGKEVHVDVALKMKVQPKEHKIGP